MGVSFTVIFLVPSIPSRAHISYIFDTKRLTMPVVAHLMEHARQSSDSLTCSTLKGVVKPDTPVLICATANGEDGLWAFESAQFVMWP